MYAVVRTGGKQYKVSLGDRIRVDKLDYDAGTCIDLDDVLMVADGEATHVGTPAVGVHVSATVVAHGRGRKIKVFKMRRRKNYRRTQGHRQDFTELEITAIGEHVAPDAVVDDTVIVDAETAEPTGSTGMADAESQGTSPVVDSVTDEEPPSGGSGRNS